MSETKHTPGSWQYTFFTKFGGDPIETAQDVADTVALSALQSDKGELWGITIETGEKPCPVVCYTGNGPTSEANAELIVRAVNSHEELVKMLKRHAQGLRNLVEFKLVPASHFDATIIEAEHTERLIAKAEGRS